MRRMMVGLLGLGATVLLSLEGCSSPGPAANADARHVAAVRDNDDEKGARQDAAAFELPRDRTGQLLGQVLPPRTKQGPLDRPDRPAPPTVPAPRFVEPASPLPMGTALVSRAPAPPRKGEL